ncbi:hypothetical protein EO95_05915 [Methanosarcina sp. 1.H.T.1A.1]|nr:hypothetical protein EO93_09325 [Methanosarcina sp. 1.H.A.2.2]KKH97507.1 hypothetical protein EO95_05915 [Methanosarcina sp. 1.H.T.1A.1]
MGKRAGRKFLNFAVILFSLFLSQRSAIYKQNSAGNLLEETAKLKIIENIDKNRINERFNLLISLITED